jgi:2-keto-4-pentenoate hydratase/2-oxohepta-3-ene-1,7-dioic acid hydratase in catechol pathway
MLLARAFVGNQVRVGEVEGDRFYGLNGDIFAEPHRSGWSASLDELTLLSPCEPRRMFMVIAGFMPPDGSPLPEGTVPILMPKITSTVSGQDGQIVYPSWATAPIVAEGELALVIGKTVHNGSVSEANDAILGYSCFNDVTALEFFTPSSIPARDFFRAKSIESFASLGPWIRTDVTPDAIEAGMGIATRVNGEERQHGNTKTYRFSPATIISSLSTYVTFLPGDVISLGTPPPAPEISPGDLVEVEVDGIGVLRNHVVNAKDAAGFPSVTGEEAPTR